VDQHAIARWRERVNPSATNEQVIRACCFFLIHGHCIDQLPDWVRPRPGKEYWAHPHWPSVVIVVERVRFRFDHHDGPGQIVEEPLRLPHVITVCVPQDDGVTDMQEAVQRAGPSLHSHSLGARAVFRRDRGINEAS
jgi:hypothetical protein